MRTAGADCQLDAPSCCQPRLPSSDAFSALACPLAAGDSAKALAGNTGCHKAPAASQATDTLIPAYRAPVLHASPASYELRCQGRELLRRQQSVHVVHGRRLWMAA